MPVSSLPTPKLDTYLSLNMFLLQYTQMQTVNTTLI